MSDCEMVVISITIYVAAGYLVLTTLWIFRELQLRNAFKKMGCQDKGVVAWFRTESSKGYLPKFMDAVTWALWIYKLVKGEISTKLTERQKRKDKEYIEETLKRTRATFKDEAAVASRLLDDVDVRVRKCVVQEIDSRHLTPELIERGLTDQSPEVRKAFIWNDEVPMLDHQIERALTDVDPEVRTGIAFRGDYQATSAQIERGISDECPAVRLWFFHRYAVTSMTRLQLEHGVRDTDQEVREHLTTKLVKAGINSAAIPG